MGCEHCIVLDINRSRFTGYAEAMLTSELGDWIVFQIADHSPGEVQHLGFTLKAH
jgi:hypothetical protein